MQPNLFSVPCELSPTINGFEKGMYLEIQSQGNTLFFIKQPIEFIMLITWCKRWLKGPQIRTLDYSYNSIKKIANFIPVIFGSAKRSCIFANVK